jgi:hypothetical protein
VTDDCDTGVPHQRGVVSSIDREVDQREPPAVPMAGVALTWRRSDAEHRTWAVAHGGIVTDEWHIQIEQRYLNNEAGAGARAKAQELAGQKSTARRFLERVLDPKTEDRSWRRGAEGEKKVAAELDKLGELGGDPRPHHRTQRANLDRLYIGRPACSPSTPRT